VISIEACRALLADPASMTDADVAALRDQLYEIAALVLDVEESDNSEETGI
jgi:hypothetical protein